MMRLLFGLVAPVVAFTLVSCQNRTVTEQAGKITSLEKENAQLRAQAEKLKAELAEAQALASHDHSPVQPQPAHPDVKPNPEDSPAVRSLRASLVEANTTIGSLQAQISRLNDSMQAEAAGAKRLQDAHSELRAKLEAAEKATDNANQELRKKDDRIDQLVEAARSARDDATRRTRRLAELSRLAEQMEDLERRREDSADNLLSRYREVTEQYRALAGAIEGQQSAGGGVSRSLDLSRIQQTIASAEEELRQLRTLNSQAMRLQKQIALAVK